MKKAHFSLAEVYYAVGDDIKCALAASLSCHRYTVIETSSAAQTKVNLKVDNVAGVQLPIFDKSTKSSPLLTSFNTRSGHAGSPRPFPWRTANKQQPRAVLCCLGLSHPDCVSSSLPCLKALTDADIFYNPRCSSQSDKSSRECAGARRDPTH